MKFQPAPGPAPPLLPRYIASRESVKDLSDLTEDDFPIASNEGSRSRFRAFRESFWSLVRVVEGLLKNPPEMAMSELRIINDAHAGGFTDNPDEAILYGAAWRATAPSLQKPLTAPSLFGHTATSFHELVSNITHAVTRGFVFKAGEVMFVPPLPRFALDEIFNSSHCRAAIAAEAALLRGWDPNELFYMLQLEASWVKLHGGEQDQTWNQRENASMPNRTNGHFGTEQLTLVPKVESAHLSAQTSFSVKDETLVCAEQLGAHANVTGKMIRRALDAENALKAVQSKGGQGVVNQWRYDVARDALRRVNEKKFPTLSGAQWPETAHELKTRKKTSKIHESIRP